MTPMQGLWLLNKVQSAKHTVHFVPHLYTWYLARSITTRLQRASDESAGCEGQALPKGVLCLACICWWPAWQGSPKDALFWDNDDYGRKTTTTVLMEIALFSYDPVTCQPLKAAVTNCHSLKNNNNYNIKQ
ncbi:uncharacterized protein CIMG_13107 [Coccidioides immitis RS]|uniref:Uncharacterized protein n=1 Tax=Coccidioides immitis (strain RS) TaxID=246410 RepID=A0A0D8JUS7_COCIM|nr:uncharacterized protein CIMG_13107 [Coccidioides immitis RS]KJF60661.1 hypothetical protein CIMG_13107 [Coccidioides immitis RS]